MKFCSITSGSSGNCIYVGSSKTSVLVDAGISGKRIEEGLNTIDQTTKDIDGILVTHEHSDHIKGLGVLARRYGMPIYATKGTIEALKKMPNIGKIPEELFHVVKADEPFNVKDLTCEPFTISHDAAEPCGFKISHDGKAAAVATDTGCYDDYLIDHLKDLDVLLLEANHDIHMLEAGPYPYYLKRRIMSDHGHLSNDDAGELLGKVLNDHIKQVFLGHLSHENNYEKLAYETVSTDITMGDNPYNAKDFHISIAHRGRVSEPVIF